MIHRFYIGAILLLAGLFGFQVTFATTVTGGVIDAASKPVAFASIYIKGSTIGTTANAEGRFALELAPGKYTLYCSHVGLKREEKEIVVAEKTIDIFFRLYLEQAEMKDVVVKANAEDPAYAIIRKAIKSRESHLNEVKQWQVNVYMKGIIRTVQLPKSIFGIKMKPDKDIIDSSGKGIIYLSESITKYSKRLPNDFKEDIISAKVSGRSSGFGFNSPATMEVNLYENNIPFQGINERGFVSPIANNALNFYKYKYEGSIYEDGVEISKIKVTPKRTYEPRFAGGYIYIVEGTWHVHSIDLYLNKTSQIEIVDSLHIQQQMLFVNRKNWMPQQTIIFGSLSIFGIKANANFTAMYSDYDLEHEFPKKFFGNIVRTADTSSSKTSMEYWEKIRPVPLTGEEEHDYVKKDSLEKKYNNPKYLDSLDKQRNKLRMLGLIAGGYSNISRTKKMIYNFPSIIETLSYNTVEGAVVNFAPTIRHYGDTNAFTLTPNLRYGFGNKHFHASLLASKTFSHGYNKRWNLTVEGGTAVSQINPQNPIDPLPNTITTLLYKENYMRLYEKSFGTISVSKRLADGLRGTLSFSYEDRHLPQNVDTTYVWFKNKNKHFFPNYPEELPQGYFPDHQALVSTIRLSYQPGQKFIQYPRGKFSIGSDMPEFTLIYNHGWKNTLGSDVDFDRWRLLMDDQLDFKLAGQFDYRLSVGGFFNKNTVYLPDWQHFLGNEATFLAGRYLQAYQLSRYYALSTIEDLYVTAHVEHHLNGALLNKIPFLKKFNLGLLGGNNTFYASKNNYYTEFFVGIENILKLIRVDAVWGYTANIGRPQFGFKLGLAGIFLGGGNE